MQIWVPKADFGSIRLLNNRHLSNQVACGIQWVITNKGEMYPYYGLWYGHLKAVAKLGLVCIEELERRGLSSNLKELFQETFDNTDDTGVHHLFGNYAYHAGIRSTLLAKDPEFYAKYKWKEKPGQFPLIYNDPTPNYKKVNNYEYY
jgi:hypothetical protein